MKDICGRKVLHTLFLHLNADGGTSELAEIITTCRDCYVYRSGLQCLTRLISKLVKADHSDPACCLASRKVLPSFIMSDQDLALLNGCSLEMNGVK